MNKAILVVILNFLCLILSAQSNVNLTDNYEDGELHFGNVIIQTIPSDVIVKIPKLKINGRKFQDSLILEEIRIGIYKLKFSSKGKSFKCQVDIKKDQTMHVFVDVENKSCKIEEIDYKPYLRQKLEEKKRFVVPDNVLSIVDEMPEYPDGAIGCQRFIAQQVRYPLDAMKNGIVGKVYVNFIVNKNGEVVNVKNVRSVHPLLDREAVRVFSKMPKWKPGKHKGELVDVSFTFPINFQLQ